MCSNTAASVKNVVVDLPSGEIPWRLEGLTFNDAVGMDAERVVVFGDGELAAFGVAEGDERWRVEDLPEGRFTVEAFSDWPHGFVADSDAGRTIAVDLRDGERRWTLDRAVVPRRVETASEGEVVVFVDDGHVERLDPATGETTWEQSIPAETALLAEMNLGLVVVFAENQFWGLSLQDGSMVRNTSLDGPVRSVDGYGETLYATAEETTGYDAEGEQSFASGTPAAGGAFPVIADDHLVTVAGSTVYGFVLDGEPADPGTTEPTTTAQTTTDGDETTGSGTPGFGLVSAALGVGGLAEYIRRRQDEEE